MIDNEKSSIWPEPFSPKAGLYLVATPIGHLRDITLRALDVLKAADVILCEDKRVSVKLLNAYGIKKPLKPYHDHSTSEDRSDIIKLLKQNKVVALISDAGMPMIADPGYKLVRECYKNDVSVYSVPGASAVLSAIQLSALPSDCFTFCGFLPAKAGARKSQLETIKNNKEVSIFFETANRLVKTLADIKSLMPERMIVVARELTKKFEEVVRGTAAEIEAYFEQNTLKGEIVVLIEGVADTALSLDDLDGLIKDAMQRVPFKAAVDHVRAQTGLPKKQIYNRALELKDGNE